MVWPVPPPAPAHLWGTQLGPIRLEIVDNAIQGPGKQHSTYQQHDEDHIGECSGEVDNLGGRRLLIPYPHDGRPPSQSPRGRKGSSRGAGVPGPSSALHQDLIVVPFPWT